MEQVDGFFQPDHPRRTRKSLISRLDLSIPNTQGPVPYVEEQMGSGALQISEGCPCFCSFCAESWDRKPYRERSGSSVIETALQAKAYRGLDSADLYSFNFNMHSDLYSILWELIPNFRTIGLKSQRFDLLAHDPVMAEVQHAVEKASFTCGLEGISPRLRKYLQKNLSEQDLKRALTSVFKSKCREIKIFLIATGLEQNEDFETFGIFLEWLKAARQAAHSGTRVIFSMTPLVRFPWTPLEFQDAPQEAVYQAIIRQTAARVRSSGFEFREAADLPEYWVSQLLVRARAGDEKISRALLFALQACDTLYYRTVSPAFRKALETALISQGLSIAELFKGIPPEASVIEAPWTWIETGVKREFLVKTWKQIREFEESDYCLGRSWVQARCLQCGGCPTPSHIRDIVSARQERRFTVEQFKTHVQQHRKQEVGITFLVNVGKSSLGLPRRMLGVALARALMLEETEFVKHYRGYSGCFWGADSSEVWFDGEERLDLLWNEAGVSELRKILSDPKRLANVSERLGNWGTLTRIAESKDSERANRSLRLVSTAQPCLDSYLRKNDLKHTLRKNAGRVIYEFTPAALKKGLFRSLELTQEGDSWLIQIVTGPKLTGSDIQALCKNAFVLRHPEDWVRVRCTIG